MLTVFSLGTRVPSLQIWKRQQEMNNIFSIVALDRISVTNFLQQQGLLSAESEYEGRRMPILRAGWAGYVRSSMSTLVGDDLLKNHGLFSVISIYISTSLVYV